MNDTNDATAVLVDARDTIDVLELAEVAIGAAQHSEQQEANAERRETMEATIVRMWATVYGRAPETAEASWAAMEAHWPGPERVTEIRDGVRDLLVLDEGTARELANLVATSPIAKTAATFGEMVAARPEPQRQRALALQQTLYPDGKVPPTLAEMVRREGRA